MCVVLALWAPCALAETPPAETATTSAAAATPIETGSVGHPDAEIGAAARDILVPGHGLNDAHLLPEERAPSASEGATPPDVASAAPPPTPEDLDRTALADFYKARGDEPLWVTADGYAPKALSVIDELQRASDWGLDPKLYEATGLPSREGKLTAQELALAESSLSLAVLAYARHARGGLIPEPAKQLSTYIDRKPQYRKRDELLDELAKTDDAAGVLVGLHPQHPQFMLLREAWLETKRAANARNAKLPKGELIAPGATHADIALLRRRMGHAAAEGVDPEVYDARLARAVAGFQRLKGIDASGGTLTPETRTKLNEPIKGKSDQLAANMQMWRWMPETLGDMHVIVNVPEFMIRIIRDEETVFEERITAGLVNKQTPVFSASMNLVTFKSRWRVPDSIKVQEVWPSLLSGGGLMRQHKLEMRRLHSNELVDWRTIDWSKADMSEYAVWQPPGPWNQLGLVKFSFPNKHYVFMHDTPDKHMFAWKRRANSHGCMRIRNPLRMAEVILGADQGWDRARVDDAVKNGPDHNIIKLERRIPTHMTYFTVRVGTGGALETFGDVYGHERRIVQALAGQWDRIAKGRDHLAPVDEKTPPRVAARKAPKPAAAGDDSVQSLISSALGGL